MQRIKIRRKGDDIKVQIGLRNGLGKQTSLAI